jgi:hypothetical protein
MKWTGGQWQRVEKTVTQVRTVAMERRKGKRGERPRNPREQNRTPYKGRSVRRRNLEE